MKIGINYMKIIYKLCENYIELLLMNGNDSDFLLVIFDLLLIIGVIYRRKYELINNLKIF